MPAGIVAAHWPMLPAGVQKAMYTKPLNPSKRPYDSPILEVNNPIAGAQQSISFTDLATNCGAKRLVLSNPLAYDPDDATQTTALCVAPACEIVSPEYRAVFVKNEIVKDDVKDLSISFDPLLYFFDRPSPLNVKQVGIVGDGTQVSTIVQDLLLPFVQTRIMIMRVGNPVWQNALNGTESTRVTIAPGDPVYIEDAGITTAAAPQTFIQYFRTITIPDQRWNDGTQVRAKDYVNGFQNNIKAVRGLITAVEASGDKRIIIRYLPGLPKELADAIAPAALHDVDILTESMGDWRVVRDGNTFNLTHSDDRKSFSISDQTSLQQMVDGLRKGTYDVAMSDPVQTAELLAIPELQDFGYTIRLVPTGALWVLQK